MRSREGRGSGESSQVVMSLENYKKFEFYPVVGNGKLSHPDIGGFLFSFYPIILSKIVSFSF